MKEDEAKKKWCPSARVIAVDNNNQVLNKTSFNRANREDGSESFEPNGSNCIGSDCMMWEVELKFEEIEKEVKIKPKWEDYTKHESNGFKKHRIETSKKDGFVTVIFNRYVDSDSGDCGLKSKELYCEGCNQ